MLITSIASNYFKNKWSINDEPFINIAKFFISVCRKNAKYIDYILNMIDIT